MSPPPPPSGHFGKKNCHPRRASRARGEVKGTQRVKARTMPTTWVPFPSRPSDARPGMTRCACDVPAAPSFRPLWKEKLSSPARFARARRGQGDPEGESAHYADDLGSLPLASFGRSAGNDKVCLRCPRRPLLQATLERKIVIPGALRAREARSRGPRG